MKKYICEHCKNDFRANGWYQKTYDNYIYNENTETMEMCSTDYDSFICSQCDNEICTSEYL